MQTAKLNESTPRSADGAPCDPPQWTSEGVAVASTCDPGQGDLPADRVGWLRLVKVKVGWLRLVGGLVGGWVGWLVGWLLMVVAYRLVGSLDSWLGHECDIPCDCLVASASSTDHCCIPRLEDHRHDNEIMSFSRKQRLDVQ